MKLYNKDGSLTAYALSCGYVEKYKVRNINSGKHTEITLKSISSAPVYEVLCWVVEDARVVDRHVHYSLTESRKVYKRYIRYVNKGIMY